MSVTTTVANGAGSLPAQFAHIPADDPDRAALEAALAEANGTAPPDPEPAPAPSAPAPASDPANPSAAGEQDGNQPMVPHTRFQQANRAAQEALARVQYLEGALAAMQAQQGQPQGQPAPAAQPPQATVTQRLTELERALVELADEWESGQGMTAGEMEKQRLVLMGRIMNTRDEVFAQRLMGLVRELVGQSLAGHTGLVDEQALEAQIGVLETKHPWLKILPDEQIRAIERIALAEGEALAKPYGQGTRELARLRARVAVLSDRYGPEWNPDMTPPAAAAPGAPAPAAPANPNAPAPSGPTAQDRLAAMNARAAHPPNEPTNRAVGDATLTVEAVDGMTDEQIESGLSVDRLRSLVGLPQRR